MTLSVLISVVGSGASVMAATVVDSGVVSSVDRAVVVSVMSVTDSGGISKPSRSGRGGAVVTSSWSVGGEPLDCSGNGLGKTCLAALSGSSC